MNRAKGSLILLMLACLSNGCTFGVKTPNYRPAQEPKGVNMRIDTSQGKLSGELIEVRNAGIVVLVDQKLRFLPYTAIQSATADQTDSATISRTEPKPDVREHLRLLSRFPQGLSPELLRQLLDAYGQTELAGANP